MSGGTYRLMPTPTYRFLRNLFVADFCQKSIEGEIGEKYFFISYSFWCLTRETNPGFTPNKPTHYLPDYGVLPSAHFWHKLGDEIKSPWKVSQQIVTWLILAFLRNWKGVPLKCTLEAQTYHFNLDISYLNELKILMKYFLSI